MAPAICGVAMEVPLAIVYALSELLLADRVFVPGAADIRFYPAASIDSNGAAAAKESNAVGAGV